MFSRKHAHLLAAKMSKIYWNEHTPGYTHYIPAAVARVYPNPQSLPTDLCLSDQGCVTSNTPPIPMIVAATWNKSETRPLVLTENSSRKVQQQEYQNGHTLPLFYATYKQINMHTCTHTHIHKGITSNYL